MNGAYVRDHYLHAFRAVEDRLPGQNAPWLRRMRAQAMEYFMDTGLPELRNEDWKYTSVGPIEKKRFQLPAAHARVTADALKPYALGAGRVHRLVFVDGRFAPELSEVQSLPKGVTVTSLAQTLDDDPGATQGHLGGYADPQAHGFAALNTAFIADGAYVRLAEGTAVDEPIQLLYISTGANEAVSYLRNLVVAEDNSAATLIETYVSLDDAAYLTNAVTEVAVERNASVEHYKLERESEKAYHIGGLHIAQERDSRYTSHNVAIGGRLVRNDVHAVLDGEGSECTLHGLYVTSGRQHVDNQTRIDHRKPHCTSREWYKGVLDDHSRGVFTGRTVVHPDAQHTDAQQTNNNLLLSDNAEADSRPQLEIYADDVKCSHGSTVGQLDWDALFYLRSRAVGEDLARSLLVYAFASDILEHMKLVPVRSQLEGDLTGKLLNVNSLEELV